MMPGSWATSRWLWSIGLAPATTRSRRVRKEILTMFVQVIEGRLKNEGDWERLKQLGEQWEREEAGRAPGYRGFDFLRDRQDPRHFIEVVRFESAEKARE